MTRKCHVRFVGGHTEKESKDHLVGCLPNPIWSGVWLAGANPGEMPSEAAASPTTCKVLKTASGHTLLFEDATGSQRILLRDAGGQQVLLDVAGAKIAILGIGEIILQDGAGSRIVLNGGSIRISAAGQVLINS